MGPSRALAMCKGGLPSCETWTSAQSAATSCAVEPSVAAPSVGEPSGSALSSFAPSAVEPSVVAPSVAEPPASARSAAELSLGASPAAKSPGAVNLGAESSAAARSASSRFASPPPRPPSTQANNHDTGRLALGPHLAPFPSPTPAAALLRRWNFCTTGGAGSALAIA